MSWPELHETLEALTAAFDVPFDEAISSGLVVERAELDIPLEVMTATGPNGPVVFARAPHSRWISGVLPTMQTGHLVIESWHERESLAGGAP